VRQNGHIEVPDWPGLGIEASNDRVLMEHMHPDIPRLWEEASQWDHDRLWS